MNEGLPAVEETRLLHHTVAAHRDSRSTQSNGEYDEFASTPVSNDQPWARVTLIFVSGALSLPSFVAGVDVFVALAPSSTTNSQGASSSLVASITAILCGNVILVIIASITGVIGSRTRRNSYALVRIASGQYGAAVLNATFCISLLGWFGVNLNLFSRCIVRVHGGGIDGKLIELMGGIVMSLTTMHGIRALERLSLLLAPVLATVTVLLIAKALATMSQSGTAIEQNDDGVDTLMLLSGRLNDGASDQPMSFGQAISSVVGLSIIGAIIAPDYTRFIRESRGAVYSAFFAFAVTTSMVEFAGGIASVAFRNDDLLDILMGIGWKWEAFAVIVAGSWILNAMNLYSASLSFKATISGLESRVCVGVLGILGTLVAYANILDSFLSFLFYLSVTFALVAGVIAIDYVFLRRSVYAARDESSLERPACRPIALLAWAFGVASAVLGSANVISITGIAVLDALIVSAVSYYMMCTLGR